MNDKEAEEYVKANVEYFKQCELLSGRISDMLQIYYNDEDGLDPKVFVTVLVNFSVIAFKNFRGTKATFMSINDLVWDKVKIKENN